MVTNSKQSNPWQRLLYFIKTPRGGAITGALLIFVLLILIWWQVIGWYQKQLLAEQSAEAAVEVSLRGGALSSAINRRFAVLRGLHAFARTESVSQDFDTQFLVFSANLYANARGLQNISAAPDGVIRHIYPQEGYEYLLGVDLINSNQRDLKNDVQNTIESGGITLGLPYELNDLEGSLAARKVVHRADGTLWGLVTIIIDLPSLISETGIATANSPERLEFTILDSEGRTLFGSNLMDEQDQIAYNLILPEDEWTLIGHQTEGWREAHRSSLFPFQIAGLIIVGLLTGIVYLSINRQRRLSLDVHQKTEQISQINISLEQRIRERTQDLNTLLQVSQNIASTLNLEDLLELILVQLKSVIEFASAVIYLLEGENTLLLLKYKGRIEQDKLPTYWKMEGALHYQQVIDERQSVIIPDINADTPLGNAWRETTQSHLEFLPDYIRSWMGVPMLIKERVIGLIVFHHEDQNYYSQHQSDLALASAHQAAIAIENARLYEQAQQLAALKERQRLARELHDSVSQALYGIALGARTARTKLDRITSVKDLPELNDSLDYVLSLSEAALTEMRALIFELRPEALETEGLVGILKKQAEALRIRYKIEVTTSFCEEPPLALDVKQTFYRVAQEAINNIIKHAQATQVELTLRCDGDSLTLNICDNGIGFDQGASYLGHLGLHIMRERIEQIGGSLQIESHLGEGTLVRLSISSLHTASNDTEQ
ncbi:MAG: histidine kinase [Anaerolineales bacterium]|jgi:signal transduction histidine kinase